MGGAIRAPKIVDIEPPEAAREQAIPARPRSVLDLSYEGMRPRVPTVLHGIPRILLESGIPYFMLERPSYSDNFLVSDLKKVVPPGGSSKHVPEVRQAIFDSFEQHPELLQHYLRT